MVTNRLAAVVLAAAALLAPAGARGQHARGDDVEVIEPPRVKPAPDAKKPDLARAATQVVEKTNAFRKEQGRSPVAVNDRLAKTAADFARYMARTDRYGHAADGKQPADRAAAHGYEYCIVLENIAYQYNSAGFATEALARGLFEGWKTSPGHRKNMLDPDVTETGVAVARSDRTGYYYAVQLFGRPKSKAIRYSIANRSDAAVTYTVGEQSFSLPPRYTRSHTRCRPGELAVTLPGASRARAVTPKDGDRFVITRSGDDYQLKKE